MRAVSDILLKIIDFFLSPANRVSVQARMRARIVVFIFLFWAFLDIVAVFLVPLYRQAEIVIPGIFIFVNLISALLIKLSFSPKKVYFTYSGLYVILQLLMTAFMENLEPLSFIVFITFIYINCLVTSNLKIRFFLMAFILVATYLTFALLYNANRGHLWSIPADPLPGLFLLALSIISYLAIFPMVSKIKALAQFELDMEVLWQERAKRLEDSASTTRAMGELLTGPIQAVQKDLEQFKKGSDPSAMDDMEKQLDELLLISNAVNWIYRTQRGEESLSTPSAQQEELIGELLLKIKAPQSSEQYS